MEMMEKEVISATRRTVTGKKVANLRREGKLPGVLYGRHMQATPITMDLKETSRILAGLTSSSLISVNIDGTIYRALVREKQYNFILRSLTHVDFQAVSETEKIRAKVAVELTGTSPAVKDFDGLLVTGLEELDVESLPKDLPERFVVDVSALKSIGDSIYVRDIVVPAGVEIFDDGDELIVVVTHAGAEEEITEGVSELAEPEVIERGKKEEDIED